MASQLIALVWFSAYRGSEALNMLVHGLSNVEALEAAESSVSRSSARDVRVLAERFESPGCQGAIKDANFKAWSTIVYPEHPWQGGRKAEVHRNTDIRVAYVRNQKAGSTYMEQSLRTLFQHDDFGVQMEEFEVLPWHGNHHQSNITDEWFVFTMVRDPLLTAHAAYLEVARRSQIMDESSHHDQRVSPRYRYMPCHEKEQRTRRFKMYLKELPLAPNMFSVEWPQSARFAVLREQRIQLSSMSSPQTSAWDVFLDRFIVVLRRMSSGSSASPIPTRVNTSDGERRRHP